MILSHRHRFIFLKTQKTAGTSVELGLRAICGPEDVVAPLPMEDRDGDLLAPQNCEIPLPYRNKLWRVKLAVGLKPRRAGVRYFEHMNAKEVRGATEPGVFDSYRKVTIVRNAWDREVSLYFWATRDKKERPSFTEFVNRRVWRPERKTFEIYSIDGKVIADVVLRYEDLAAQYAGFVQSLGVAEVPPLQHAKGTFRAKEKRDFRSFYDTQTKEVVRRRQAREIEYFGMTFD